MFHGWNIAMTHAPNIFKHHGQKTLKLFPNFPFACHCSTGIEMCVYMDLQKKWIVKLANAWNTSNTEKNDSSFNCHFHASALTCRWSAGQF